MLFCVLVYGAIMTKERAIELLDEALHQLWHAIHDQANFNRETARKAYESISAEREADEPACDHDWKLKAGFLDSTGEHYTDGCTKCLATRQRHSPL